MTYTVFPVSSSFGPMACDVDSLVTVMRALLVPYMFELDGAVPPLPFNDEVREEQDEREILNRCKHKHKGIRIDMTKQHGSLT